MFTGLVEGVGIVQRVERRGGALRIAVDLGPVAERIAIGESVGVSGCCLTVAGIEGAVALFDAIPETLARTWLGSLLPGDRVNLERALRAGDRLGGHLVQGHVDGTAVILSRRDEDGQQRFDLEADRHMTEEMVTKGSIALDGISLTLVATGPGRFAVCLIPHTLSVTTAGGWQEGRRVNVETDLIGKWVRRLVAPYLPKS